MAFPSLNKKAKFVLALVTAPNLKTARSVANSVLSARLAACVNLVPKIESHYWWQGKIDRGAEVLMLIKTTRDCLARLEKEIIARHPYDTPEFIVLTVAGGNKRYLDWLSSAVSTQRTTNKH
jgi:periplasmic divalent cation tolerance protein